MRYEPLLMPACSGRPWIFKVLTCILLICCQACVSRNINVASATSGKGHEIANGYESYGGINGNQKLIQATSIEQVDRLPVNIPGDGLDPLCQGELLVFENSVYYRSDLTLYRIILPDYAVRPKAYCWSGVSGVGELEITINFFISSGLEFRMLVFGRGREIISCFPFRLDELAGLSEGGSRRCFPLAESVGLSERRDD